MSLISVVDVETTGFAPPAEVIEIGRTGVWSDARMAIGMTESTVFRPVNGNPAEARAIHHLGPKDFAGAPVCGPEDFRSAMINAQYACAHNADMERQWFTSEIIGDIPWICTQKAALRIWPEAPKHTNSVLRYWLEDQGLIPDLRDAAQPAHRAGPDTLVTAHILVALLQHATLDQMVQWTLEPRVLPRCPIGKEWKGKPWREVDDGFLNWMLRQPDMESEYRWNAQHELNRRKP